MLWVNELKNIGRGFLALEILCFLTAWQFGMVNSGAFFENIITVFATVLCSKIVYGSGDIELLVTLRRPFVKILFGRYLVVMGCLTAVTLPEIGFVLAGEKSVRDLPACFGFLPTALFMSSLCVLFVVLFRSAIQGLIVSALMFPVEYAIGSHLQHHRLPPWYEYFSFFDTTFMRNSPLWLTNRVLLVCGAAVVWVCLYLLFEKKKWQLAD